MKLRTIILALFTGSTFISSAANAFWFFHRPAAPARHVIVHHHHARHHRWHHHDHHRRGQPYRRIITEYRIYYVPVPLPAHSARAKSPAAGHPFNGASPASAPVPGTLSHNHPERTAVAGTLRPPAPVSGVDHGSVQTVPAQKGQQANANQKATVAAGTGRLPTAAVPSMAAGDVRPSADPGQLKGPAPARPGVISGASAALQPKTQLASASLPAVRTAAAADRSDHDTKPSIPLAPIAAAASLAGLGYVVSRKRKRMKPDGRGLIKDDQTLPGAEVASPLPGAGAAPSLAQRKGFNYDEIRRVNVDQVLLAPPPLHTQADLAVADSGQNAIAPAGQSGDAPLHDAQHVIVRHACGDTITGRVAELYNTPELKAGLAGFYENIPAQFHDATWAKVAYQDDRNFTFAIVPPEMNVLPGDSVQLAFGQQEPPVPNQITSVLSANAANPC